jgi:serine protease Do
MAALPFLPSSVPDRPPAQSRDMAPPSLPPASSGQTRSSRQSTPSAHSSVQRRIWHLLVASSFVVLNGCSGLRPPALPNNNSSSPAPLGQPVVNATTPEANFIVKVVEQVGPAVVRINASRRAAQNSPESPFDRFSNLPPEESEQIERGTGSGFIFDANGLVMTNRHVINGADRVTVLLKDGRQFQGEVLGEDPLTDVAVVKIAEANLPTVKLGDSRRLTPGDWAIAIGNPLGLDNTVTVGIVSAIGRPAAAIGDLDLRVRFVQTDAAINPGNSGGPLLNEWGEVIGVNTAIIQGAQGLGFAIPIDDANRISKQLVKSGKVVRAYLGVEMVDITPESRESLQERLGRNLGNEIGVYVMRVVPDSPAARGGIANGDVIASINNKAIDSAEELQQTIEQSQSGATVNVEVKRQGKPQQFKVTLGDLPPASAATEPQPEN